MATKTPDENTPVIQTGTPDRVAGLSIKSDGTLDQTNPVIIGDKDAVLENTKEQFRQIAVSAVDAEKRVELGLASDDKVDTSDAKIDALKKEHQAAEASAEKKAESVVNALSEDK